MGMEGPSTSVPPLLSGVHSTAGRVCVGSSPSWGHRGDILYPLSGSSLFCPKEGNRQKTGHPRPVNPQQINSMPILQDDHCSRCKERVTRSRLCNFNRFEGCVLAYSYCETFPEIPGISDRKKEVQIQSHALWPQRGTTDVYKNLQAYSPGTPSEGHRGFSLPGRLANLGQFSGGVSPFYSRSDSDTSKERLHGQFHQIQTFSRANLRVARHPMGYQVLPSFNTKGQGEGFEKGSEALHKKAVLVQKTARKSYGEASVCLASRSAWESSLKVSKSTSSPLCSLSQEGLVDALPEVPQGISKEMASPGGAFHHSSSSPSSSVSGCVYRRFSRGLGSSLFKRPSCSRGMVKDITEMSHKYSGAGGGFLSDKEPSNSEKVSYTPTFRQHHSSELSKQTGFSQINSFELLGDQHHQPPAVASVSDFSLPHCRSAQCHCGQSVPVEASVVGMVSGHDVLPGPVSADLRPTSGSFCNKGKPSSPNLCFPSKGLAGSRDGRVSHELEHLGTHLPVPTGPCNHESDKCSGELQGEGPSHHSHVAESGMVSSAVDQSSNLSCSAETVPVAEGRGTDYLLLIKQHEDITMLDFLKIVYSDKFSSDSAEVLVRAVRKSTAGQYHSIWRSFCEFLRDKNPSRMTVEFVLSYLRFLFDVKKLAPSTISSYKSALSRPLGQAFNIDVSLPPFPDFIKAIFNIRPSKPATPIRWSLDKVLSFALSPRFQQDPSVNDQLAISLFLTALATGGRSSELSALLRLEKNLIASGEGITLYPNPNFLAKNENPRCRKDPIFIPRLNDEAGGPHPLCPVFHIEKFVKTTIKSKSVKLFVDPVTLEDLSTHKVRLWICKFIKWGDPGSFPCSHDLRKVSSTLAFLRSMSLEEICNVTGWSSVRVFRKHYFKRISEVAPKLVILGSQD